MANRAVQPEVFDTPRAEPASRAWLRALEWTANIDREPTRVLPRAIAEVAARTPRAPALLSDRERFTYAELIDRANRYARWAINHGVDKGDVVGLMMPNRPEYMAVWLGVVSVGGVVALLNTSLSGPSLAHSIGVAAPKHLIVDAVFADIVNAALADREGCPTIWAHGAGDRRIDLEIETLCGDALTDAEQRPVTLSDPALLIYTSGTTGLPKAARVSHHRLMSWSGWFAGMMGAEPSDRLYNCLPMYHSTGGVVATGAALVAGASVVVRDGFSARAFWDEVVRWDCTLFQYIGELCRYLLAARRSEAETQHRLRLCSGNGLRKDVWLAFEARFRIPKILEFYASTEGNFSLFNAEGVAGYVGRTPSFLAHRFPAALVQLDPATGEPTRGADGLCVKCAADEPGEAIGRVGVQGASRFEGYTDASSSERKLLRDVFEPGDVWMRTGDLMKKDVRGYWTFIDRLGDTFRWKGENVSASEVAAAISGCPGVKSAAVYGVQIPGAEGRAGMAALVVEAGFDVEALRARLAARLPDYARPLFLREVNALDHTGTFKQQKGALQCEGFDPARVADVLWFDDRSSGRYVRLDCPLYDRIVSGAVRL
ncbi:MAG TPA: long-chain-acyl-CoA synthetase [Caulobacteraceae bacterium]|jgi:fatty-acyl-CoA synthase|nr:long-chain-acyl-CoA synthetase [Caulobacteraceae bacterium]